MAALDAKAGQSMEVSAQESEGDAAERPGADVGGGDGHADESGVSGESFHLKLATVTSPSYRSTYWCRYTQSSESSFDQVAFLPPS